MKWDEALQSIWEGGIGIIPTDTLYGLVGSARLPEAVERIYAIKGRDENKPLIILIGSLDDLAYFKTEQSAGVREFLEENWPAPLSVILSVPDGMHGHLHPLRGTLAFRMPRDPELLAFLRSTGPLVAPSANPQGMTPARTIDEAQNYFGGTIDFYVDGGRLEGLPSTIIDATSGKLKLVRAGAHPVVTFDI